MATVYRSLDGTEPMTSQNQRLDPNILLGEGELDAGLLLVLWCIRKAFFPMLWIGLIAAVVVIQDVENLYDEIETRIDGLDTPAEFFSTLVSPLAGVLLALVVRVIVAVLALALAYPLTRWNHASDYARRGKRGSYMRLWWDRVYMTRSYRALRWSWAIRQEAADRLGRRGEILELCNPVLNWANAVLLVVFIVLLVLVS